MKESKANMRSNDVSQRGAALVTVVLVTLLLGTACIAMLTAVGASSRNNTDTLSEAKAFYAAESGLQATINVLRNRTNEDGSGITYAQAASDPDLSTWLPYNYPTTGTATRVVIGEPPGTYNPNAGAAYSIVVQDPDNSGVSTTFTTAGGIADATGSTFLTSRTYGSGADTTTISFTGIATARTFSHPDTDGESLGSFQVTNTGAGAAITTTRFRIDYAMSLPRPFVLSIGGEIRAGGDLAFDTLNYTVLGGSVAVTDVNLSLPTVPDVPVATQVSAAIGPIVPYRLVVTATGYGPNSATKKLEAVIQKNLFNGLSSGAATSMIGEACPPLQVCFAPGTSNGVTYNGCSAIGCVPSFGLTNPQNLQYVQTHPPGGDPSQMTPPPAMLGSSVPTWQQSPQALDALVDQLRTSAQNSGRYFVSPGGNLSDPGNFTDGTGITFCEGSCQVGGSGGGVLVVTGQLTNLGGFSFKGLIIVTGEGGWLRNGGGNGQVIGNVVIAPYNRIPYVPENLVATFLPPRYLITGGGGSDVIAGDVTAGFDNTSAISDFVAGVAEK